MYQGKIDEPFVQSVREGTLKGISMEGVVCKTKDCEKGYPHTMCKIKTNKWLQKLEEYCGDNHQLYKDLL